MTVPRAPKPQESKVARLEAALQALGPEQSSAKSALEMTLKMAKEEVPKSVTPTKGLPKHQHASGNSKQRCQCWARTT